MLLAEYICSRRLSDMKITLTQLRRLIREEVESLVDEQSCECLDCGNRFNCTRDEDVMPICPACGATADSIWVKEDEQYQ